MSLTPTSKPPIRAVLETERGRMAFIFEPRERNAIVKAAMERAGRYWIAVWMMRRFTKYAYMLGYRASGKWNLRKKRDTGAEATPFWGLTPHGGGPAAPGYSQHNGAKMADAVRGASVSSVGIAGRESLTIKIPYGHPIPSDKSAVFRKLPKHEVDAMAQEIADELDRMISGRKSVPKPAPRKVGGAMPRKVGSTPRRVA